MNYQYELETVIVKPWKFSELNCNNEIVRDVIMWCFEFLSLLKLLVAVNEYQERDRHCRGQGQQKQNQTSCIRKKGKNLCADYQGYKVEFRSLRVEANLIPSFRYNVLIFVHKKEVFTKSEQKRRDAWVKTEEPDAIPSMISK